MPISKPKILIISSASPVSGPGVLANDVLTAYQREGIEADLLTLHRVEGHPEFLYIQDKISRLGRIKHKLSCLLPYYLRQRFSKKLSPQGSFGFFYREEAKPPVRSSEVLGKIKKNYDLVIVEFWQGMLSFRTIDEIYDKLHCVIRFNAVDYSPMSGGCHFTGDCQRYQIGCGCCPAFGSNDANDFTHLNVLYREKVYQKVKPIVVGNSYMIDFFNKSYLMKNTYKVKAYPTIDTDCYRPKGKWKLRESYGVKETNRFLILFGSQRVDDERKGFKYLIEALNKFAEMLDEEKRKEVLLVVIGNDISKIKSQLHGFESLELGFVSKETLPDVYSMCDVFLCSSVNDAGPMMVNQSLCCGTPVVGFEMGACLDAVKDKGTGYCAKLRNSLDFAKGIYTIFSMSESQKQEMSLRCRKMAVDTYSYKAAVERSIQQYEEYLAYRNNSK